VAQLENTSHRLSRTEPIRRRMFSFRLACVCGKDQKCVDTAGHIYLVTGVAFPPYLHSTALFISFTGRQILNTSRHINPINAELNPICHLLALLGAHHILHVSRIRVKATERNPMDQPFPVHIFHLPPALYFSTFPASPPNVLFAKLFVLTAMW
jgi:hypothetical protein